MNNPAQLLSIYVGHYQVDEHHMGDECHQDVKCGKAVFRGLYLMPLLTEQIGHILQNNGMIIDYQDFFIHIKTLDWGLGMRYKVVVCRNAKPDQIQAGHNIGKVLR